MSLEESFEREKQKELEKMAEFVYLERLRWCTCHALRGVLVWPPPPEYDQPYDCGSGV